MRDILMTNTARLLIISGTLFIGCRDDSGGTLPIDAPDAAQTPDAPCMGHTCMTAPIYLPEGGEVRLELVYQADGPAEVRSHAFLISAQVPDLRPFTRPPSE